MAKLTPEFEVMRADSMQWNRTLNLEILSDIDNPDHNVELPTELLERVRALIVDEVGRLAAEGLTSEGDPKADDPPETRVQVNISKRDSI